MKRLGSKCEMEVRGSDLYRMPSLEAVWVNGMFGRCAAAVSLILAWFLIAMVWIYQRTLGPLLRFFNGGWGHCRHRPTCSNYAIQALRLHGGFRGTWLTVRRLLKCHPWGTHGHDPIPPVTTSRRVPAGVSAKKKAAR